MMKMVALLRGINVGGNRKIPMADLRSIVTEAGFAEVQTYIQSGNIVFDPGKLKPAQVGAVLEKAIAEHFGFHVDVVARTATQWKKYATACPFSDAAKERPHLLHVGLSQSPPDKDMISKLKERAVYGERLKLVGDAIWVDFAKSVGKSKLTPAVFDKAAGSTVTMRNWNTVVKLNEMLND